MNQDRALPRALRVVATLFFLGGVIAAVQIVVGLVDDRINLDFTVLGLFVGPGLLALKPGWRTCALVLLWISLIGLPIIGVMALAAGDDAGRFFFSPFGRELGTVPRGAFLLAGLFFFLLNAWQVRILMRDDVLRLFGVGSSGQGV